MKVVLCNFDGDGQFYCDSWFWGPEKSKVYSGFSWETNINTTWHFNYLGLYKDILMPGSSNYGWKHGKNFVVTNQMLFIGLQGPIKSIHCSFIKLKLMMSCSISQRDPTTKRWSKNSGETKFWHILLLTCKPRVTSGPFSEQKLLWKLHTLTLKAFIYRVVIWTVISKRILWIFGILSLQGLLIQYSNFTKFSMSQHYQLLIRVIGPKSEQNLLIFCRKSSIWVDFSLLGPF